MCERFVLRGSLILGVEELVLFAKLEELLFQLERVGLVLAAYRVLYFIAHFRDSLVSLVELFLQVLDLIWPNSLGCLDFGLRVVKDPLFKLSDSLDDLGQRNLVFGVCDGSIQGFVNSGHARARLWVLRSQLRLYLLCGLEDLDPPQ